MAGDDRFLEENKNHLAAGLQKTLVDILMEKVIRAVKLTGINRVALAGGVSANSGLRDRMILNQKKKVEHFHSAFTLYYDNAAMIAITGYYKWRKEKRPDWTLPRSQEAVSCPGNDPSFANFLTATAAAATTSTA
jgi:N6-L-threonylcarbamoyladenine synthase